VKRAFLSTFVAALLCTPALAAQQATTPQTAPNPHPGTNLVVVNVVVTDARHNPVHNLTKADSGVLENGQPQAIESFAEHHVWEAAAPLPQPPRFPPGTFTNYTNAPLSGALDILLLDTLNTPMSAQADVRRQILDYLKQVHPGTRMAIFGLTSRLILLQGFDSDPELLSDVLNGKKGQPNTSVPKTDQVNGSNPGEDNPTKDMPQDVDGDIVDALGNAPSATLMAANFKQFQTEMQSFLLQTRARYTLDALNQLARSLSGLPGRKNLIWFSGSFPINILPDGNLQNPFGAVASAEDEFRETVDLLSQSQVAVYPIDVRGPAVSPMRDSNEHSTMLSMAEATGGQAFTNLNGLKDAVEKAIDAGSNYYTLTYSPASQKWNGEYRKIQIEMARPNLTLAYRRGYFADDPIAPVEHGEPAAAYGPPPYNAIDAAAMRGGPDPTQVIFTASIAPTSAEPEPGLAPRNKANEKTRGPFRRYAVQIGIEAQDLACPATPEGMHKCALQVKTIVYDEQGTSMNSAEGELQTNFTADEYGNVLRSGLHFRQDISVPVSGESFLRIAIRDQTTDKVGALEVSVADIKNLPAPTTQAQGKNQPDNQN
jgi:VWFA-related protein